MVDAVTDDNGPLEVLPGSHKGPLEPLWHDGRFTGAVDAVVTAHCVAQAVRCTGPAGAVCLMHTRLLHGSAPNHSANARTLYIVVYSAEDAVPLAPNPLPSRLEGLVVHGEVTGNGAHHAQHAASAAEAQGSVVLRAAGRFTRLAEAAFHDQGFEIRQHFILQALGKVPRRVFQTLRDPVGNLARA